MAGVPQSDGKIGGRWSTIAVLILVWLGVIVIGAGPAADSASWIGVPSFDWLNYVFAGLVVLGAVIIVASLFVIPKSKNFEPRRRKPIWPMLIVAALFLILMRRERLPDGESVEAPPPIDASAPEPDATPRGTSGVEGQELVILILILGAAVGIVVWSRRGLDQDVAPGGDDRSLVQALAPAVDRAAEQLLTGTDPRSAVLMAYRSLETALEEHGMPREQTETPTEHVERALADLPGDTAPLLTSPLVKLSELYQVARFSTHPITADDQRSAATSLDHIREQLAIATRATGGRRDESR